MDIRIKPRSTKRRLSMLSTVASRSPGLLPPLRWHAIARIHDILAKRKAQRGAPILGELHRLDKVDHAITSSRSLSFGDTSYSVYSDMPGQ